MTPPSGCGDLDLPLWVMARCGGRVTSQTSFDCTPQLPCSCPGVRSEVFWPARRDQKRAEILPPQSSPGRLREVSGSRVGAQGPPRAFRPVQSGRSRDRVRVWAAFRLGDFTSACAPPSPPTNFAWSGVLPRCFQARPRPIVHDDCVGGRAPAGNGSFLLCSFQELSETSRSE